MRLILKTLMFYQTTFQDQIRLKIKRKQGFALSIKEGLRLQ